MNITEAGNNLIAIQNRLLNEKQALDDEKSRLWDLHDTLRVRFDIEIAQAEAEHSSRMAFFNARIAEIDAILGAEPEPMKMAAE